MGMCWRCQSARRPCCTPPRTSRASRRRIKVPKTCLNMDGVKKQTNAMNLPPMCACSISTWAQFSGQTWNKRNKNQQTKKKLLKTFHHQSRYLECGIDANSWNTWEPFLSSSCQPCDHPGTRKSESEWDISEERPDIRKIEKWKWKRWNENGQNLPNKTTLPFGSPGNWKSPKTIDSSLASRVNLIKSTWIQQG